MAPGRAKGSQGGPNMDLLPILDPFWTPQWIHHGAKSIFLALISDEFLLMLFRTLVGSKIELK